MQWLHFVHKEMRTTFLVCEWRDEGEKSWGARGAFRRGGTDQQDGFFVLFAPGRGAGTAGHGRFPLRGRRRFCRRHQKQSHRLVVVVEVVDGRRFRGAALNRQQPLPPQHAPRARFLHIHISYSNSTHTLHICMQFLVFFKLHLRFFRFFSSGFN